MRLLSVVLSGGAGSRLWPASRQAFPKPFMKIGDSTLLQQAVERGQACGTGDLMIVTNKDHLFLTKDVLGQMSDPPDTIKSTRSARCPAAIASTSAPRTLAPSEVCPSSPK